MMFNPKYKITENLLANIKRITALVAELNGKHFQKNVIVAMEKVARELSTFASTSIEGNPLPLTEVKKVLKNRPENLRDTEREVINYNRALEELDAAIRDNKVSLNLKLILRIQGTVTKGLILKSRNGKLRKEHVFVNDPRTGKPIYWPPDHKDVAKLMNDLVDFVNKKRNAIDPLILAGIFHKQFVIIHPFIDGNGRTARLATKVLLASMGLNTFALFSFENYYNRNVTKYFEKVGVHNNYYDIKDRIDFTGWLEYFTDGIIDELLRVGKEMNTSQISPDTGMKPHDKLIIKFIKEHGYISDREYSKSTDRAKATRTKDFKRLIGLGIIEKKGKGKATYYRMK
jgi:Fic family protein